MARLVTSGGEIQDHPTTNAGSPDGYSGGATATTTETSVVRSGAAAIKCSGTAANTSFRIFPVSFVTATDRWTRVWVRFSALPNATKKILAVTAGATLHCSVRLTAAGKLQLWNDRSGAVLQIGSDSAATLSVDTWYRLELQVKVDTAATAATANDTVELRVGVPEDPPDAAGTSVATGTVALGNTLPTEIRCGWVDAPGVTTDLFVDDLAVNDNTGTVEASWPAPDGQIVLLTNVRRFSSAGWQTCGATNNDADYAQSLDAPPVGHADTAGHTAPFHQLRTTGSLGTDFHNLQNKSYARAGVRGDTRLDSGTLTFGSGFPIGSGSGATGNETTNLVTAEKRAQQFYMNGTLESVEAYMKKVGSPTDDLIFDIVQGVTSGLQTIPDGGTVLATARYSMANLDTTGVWAHVDFDPLPLTAGQGYWVVISRDGANDAANYVVWGFPTIPGGELNGDHYRGVWKSSTSAFFMYAQAAHAMRVLSTSGAGKVLAVQNVACVGSTVTTARNGTFGSGTSGTNGGVPLIAASAFTFPNTIAGAYPTNWKWISTAVQHAPTIRSLDRGSRTHLGRTDAVADVMLSCFEGTLCEFKNPPNPG